MARRTPKLPCPIPRSSVESQNHILMLGVVKNGVAIPLLWTMLDKKGNPHSDERMDLLDRFQEIFPDVSVAFLSGDREFVGKEWLSYLLIEPSISFRLRIRESEKIGDGVRKLRTSVSPETITSDYAQRWGIETLFGMFKTRGFCLESTHRENHSSQCQLFLN